MTPNKTVEEYVDEALFRARKEALEAWGCKNIEEFKKIEDEVERICKLYEARIYELFDNSAQT